MGIYEELTEVINSFGSKLTEWQYNSYIPKLRDYFIEYVMENMKEVKNVETLFKHELTRSHLIKSTEFYIIRNENVKSKSAIDDFLIALNQLFELEINNRYYNQNLENIRPFMKLNTEIEEDLITQGINLKGKEPRPSINRNQFIFILERLAGIGESFTQLQIKIIIKLVLLYGLKPERIIDFNILDFKIDERVLNVKYNDNPNRYIKLELSNSLYKDLVEHSKLRANIIGDNNLFVKTKGKKITHSYLKNYLDIVRDDYYKKYPHEKFGKAEDNNQFTFTGLAKYSVINMILDGMNQSIIMDLTGFEDDVFGYCQEEVNKIKAVSKDRYINSNIRGIETYDLICNLK